MANLTLRILTHAGDTTKGTPLTNSEIDQNFINLDEALDTKVDTNGSGAGLTSLNATQLTTGTVPGARGLTVGSSSASFITYNGTTKTSGQFDGGAVNPSNTIRLNYDGAFFATSFAGDGSALTSLASSALTGTLSGARGVTVGSAASSFITYNGTTKTSGQFDGGSTAPTNTLRLNYDGAFWATSFNGSGSGLTGTGASFTAGAVTNGVYTTGDQSIAGIKTFVGIAFTDANYKAYVSSTNSILLMDSADYMQYDRTANTYYWAVASVAKMSLDSSGNLGTISKIAVGTTQAANTTSDINGASVGNITAVAALNIDCSLSNYFTKTISGNSTFTVSNIPASRAYAFTLELTHTSGTVTWFSGVEWPNGVAPTLTTGKTHLFMFVTDNGGTRWRASSLINYTN